MLHIHVYPNRQRHLGQFHIFGSHFYCLFYICGSPYGQEDENTLPVSDLNITTSMSSCDIMLPHKCPHHRYIKKLIEQEGTNLILPSTRKKNMVKILKEQLTYPSFSKLITAVNSNLMNPWHHSSL